MAKSENEFEKALKGEALCPDCGGPMPSPIQVTDIQPNGVPKSRYVCRYCHRRLHAQRRDVVEVREGEPPPAGEGSWLQMRLGVI